MTKKVNKGSKNQNSAESGNKEEFAVEPFSGDNSKGNKHNRTQK
jgi:hypothetical protein